jgi:hypothetical protein
MPYGYFGWKGLEAPFDIFPLALALSFVINKVDYESEACKWDDDEGEEKESMTKDTTVFSATVKMTR